MRLTAASLLSAVALVGVTASARAGDPFYGRVPVSALDEELVLHEPAPPIYPDYRIRRRYVPIAVINHAGVLYNQPFPAPRAYYHSAVISVRY